MRVVDLGAGTGSNLRYLAPRLGGAQEWLLVDYAADLLQAAMIGMRNWAQRDGLKVSCEDHVMGLALPSGDCRVGSKVLDLATDLGELDLTGIHLVTGSALLDLVSEVWLENLAAACETAGCAVLFALTYNGALRWQPSDSRDALLQSLLNRHQRTDKGFGPALGPVACERSATILERQGFRLSWAGSDWRLGTSDRAIQQALAADWAAAAQELAPEQGASIDAWLGRRGALIAQGLSRLQVGHQDLLALPETQ